MAGVLELSPSGWLGISGRLVANLPESDMSGFSIRFAFKQVYLFCHRQLTPESICFEFFLALSRNINRVWNKEEAPQLKNGEIGGKGVESPSSLLFVSRASGGS